jgi:hypothetical protein
MQEHRPAAEPIFRPGRWSVSVRLSNTSVVARDLHVFFRDHRGVYWWRDASTRVYLDHVRYNSPVTRLGHRNCERGT